MRVARVGPRTQFLVHEVEYGSEGLDHNEEGERRLSLSYFIMYSQTWTWEALWVGGRNERVLIAMPRDAGVLGSRKAQRASQEEAYRLSPGRASLFPVFLVSFVRKRLVLHGSYRHVRVLSKRPRWDVSGVYCRNAERPV